MQYISIILVILAFLKSFYYGIFEIKEKKNKFGGIVVLVLSLIRAYSPFNSYHSRILLIICYINVTET